MSKSPTLSQEPQREWGSINAEDAPFELVDVTHWYRIYATPKQLKKWTLDYVKNNMDKKHLKDYSNGSRGDYQYVGASCRILDRGCPPDLVEGQIKEGLKKIKHSTISSRKRSAEAAKNSLVKVKVNPRIKFDLELDEYMHRIHSEIDKLTHYPKIKKVEWFDAEKYFKSNNIKPEYAVAILGHLNPTLNELKQALEGEDEQLVEAYSYLKRRYLTRLVEFITTMVDVAKKYSNKNTFTKKGKKKKRKSITPEMTVKKLPRLEKCDDFGLVCKDPKDIIGCTALFVYNTQSRIIYVYIAKDNEGLSVKGATIVGFNEKKSLTKKLRNPKHDLMMMGNEKITKKLVIEHVKKIKTVEKPVRERLNKNCIIVRIF